MMRSTIDVAIDRTISIARLSGQTIAGDRDRAPDAGLGGRLGGLQQA